MMQTLASSVADIVAAIVAFFNGDDDDPPSGLTFA